MGLAGILPFLQQYMQQQAAPPIQSPTPLPMDRSGSGVGVRDTSGAALGGAPAQPPQAAQPDQTAQPAAPPVPQQTKGHKLLQILQGGLVGALDGVAQNAQTYAQTGRNAGFGGGVGGGFQRPMQRAQQQAELQQKQAQTKLTQEQGQMIDTPVGKLPVAFAKAIYGPSIAAQAKVKAAEIGAGAKKDVANTQAQSAQAVAQTNKRYMAVPNVGVLDTQDPSGKPTLIPGSEQGIQLEQQQLDDYGLPPAFLHKFMNLSQLAQLERVQNQSTTTVQGQSGPALVNKQTGKTTQLGLGNPAMGRPMEVGDNSAPGQTQITTGAQAIAQGAPGKGSASVSVPKAAAQAEVPTGIGDKKINFQTMLDHAALLRTAAAALKNGNSRTLAGLANKFNTEFGSPDVTSFDAIANAYNHEVTSVISKGHITDSEVKTGGATLPSNANLDTIDAVLDKYEALAKSKMNNLNKQKQSAITQSQPKKPAQQGAGKVLVEGKDF